MQGAKAVAGGAKVQTDPPSVPVRLLFPSGTYPEGERQSYKADNLWRETSAEKREQERLNWDMINQVCVCVCGRREAWGACAWGYAWGIRYHTHGSMTLAYLTFMAMAAVTA